MHARTKEMRMVGNGTSGSGISGVQYIGEKIGVRSERGPGECVSEPWLSSEPVSEAQGEECFESQTFWDLAIVEGIPQTQMNRGCTSGSRFAKSLFETAMSQIKQHLDCGRRCLPKIAMSQQDESTEAEEYGSNN